VLLAATVALRPPAPVSLKPPCPDHPGAMPASGPTLSPIGQLDAIAGHELGIDALHPILRDRRIGETANDNIAGA
jgi:hypothetical protein